jgi:hypothetical protein
MRDAAVVCQRGKIEELAGATGTEPDKPLKDCQIPDIDQLMYISPKIRSDIAGIPLGRI